MQKAVKLAGFEVKDVLLSADEASQVPRWRKLPISTLLDLPIAMHQLQPNAPRSSRPQNESPGFYLVADPRSGFAPPDLQMSGLGPVLLARTDGQDFTQAQWWELHNYNCHLMDCYPDWLSDGEEGERERERALTPEAFKSFTERQKKNNHDEEEEKEEEEEEEEEEEGEEHAAAHQPTTRAEGSTPSGPIVPGKNNICWSCGNCPPHGQPLLRCSACKFARYCNKECQKRGWKAKHKAICPKIKSHIYDSFEKMNESFFGALDRDLYPDQSIETLFGVEMDLENGFRSSVNSMKAGALVYSAWSYLLKAVIEMDPSIPSEEPEDYDEDEMRERLMQVKRAFKSQVLQAVIDDTLPQWFEAKVRAVVAHPFPEHLEPLGPRNAYLNELIRRKFEGIPWLPRRPNRDFEGV